MARFRFGKENSKIPVELAFGLQILL